MPVAGRLNSITRANPHLEEIIEYLDQHIALHGGNPDIARDRLTAADNQWIDDELFHCMTEPRYFISNYFAYRDEKEGFKGLYPFFDSQEILHDAYREMERQYGKVRAIVLKARQMGSTTYNVAEFFQKTIFAEHTKGLIAGNDQVLTSEIMGFYESALDFIPWWMRPRVKSKQTGEYLEFDEKDDAIRAIRPGLKTSIQALNANKPSGIGRGQTFGRGLLSELAFWADGKQLSKSLFPTFNTPDGFYVMESTAQGRNNFWHNLWRRAEAGDIDWNPIFIPFYRRSVTYSLPIPQGSGFVVTQEEEEIRIRIEKKDSFRITNETFNWMRKRKEEFIATDGDDSMFSQEYTMTAEESFQNSVVTAFPRGVIRRMAKQTINPKWIGEIGYDFDGGKPRLHIREVGAKQRLMYPKTEDRFHIWAKPIPRAKYCVGVDVSLGNDGGDYSCVQVIKYSDGHELDEQVAVWHGLIDPEHLAEVVLAIGWLYNEALVAVEVNAMGLVTNNKLIREYEYENIYRFKRLDRLKNFMTDIVGWWTEYKSKRALISKMTTMLLDEQIILRDKFTVDEFPDFTESESDEEEGSHNDFIMALLIAVYCAHEGEIRQNDRGRRSRLAVGKNKFLIKDRTGSIVAETTSQNEAERIANRYVGSSIHREAGATAKAVIHGKEFQVPADYANTEHSPIHDKDGTASKMYYDEGMEAEDITPQAIQDFEAGEEEAEEDHSGEAWKYA